MRGLLLLLLLAPGAWAAATSAKTAGTAASTGNFPFTANTGTLVSALATSDADTAYARAAPDIDGIPPDSQNSNPMDLTNFGFTSGDVPSGATIDGVTIAPTIRNPGSATNFCIDLTMQLMLSGATTGTNQALTAVGNRWPNAYTARSYCGAASLCGATLTQANVVDSTFGWRVQVSTNNNSDIATADAECRVTFLTMTINYTGGATPQAQWFFGGFDINRLFEPFYHGSVTRSPQTIAFR